MGWRSAHATGIGVDGKNAAGWQHLGGTDLGVLRLGHKSDLPMPMADHRIGYCFGDGVSEAGPGESVEVIKHDPPFDHHIEEALPWRDRTPPIHAAADHRAGGDAGQSG